ncbi:16S rRNA (uracil(1498)-N(3))-methyltransferase [Candidatus Symbiobacter mobilis]
MPRLYVAQALHPYAELALPPDTARHLQVLRAQPGDSVVVFDGKPNDSGQYGEYTAIVTAIQRRGATVQLGAWQPTNREPGRVLHLAIGMPANDRMDWLVEKASELGAASIQPLTTARSVLRLEGARAVGRQEHWQRLAIAACEQCGGNRIPIVHPVQPLRDWLAGWRLPLGACAPWLLSLSEPDAGQPYAKGDALTLLCGPEGGLDADEERAARDRGFLAVSLGTRVLRAETAALAAVTLTLRQEAP